MTAGRQDAQAVPLPRTLAAAVRGDQGPVRLQGSVHTVRRLGGVTFVVLRDRSGTVQVVLSEGAAAEDLLRETVIEVLGAARPDPRAPGGREVVAASVAVLGRPAGPPAVDVSKPALRAGLDTALDHRAVTLRHPQVRAVFRLASALCDGFRRYLLAQGFTEIHSSKLVAAATEGGANLFAVDYMGRRAFLAQSPQLYKQVCVGAFERVFEVGPVYRNEPHMTTRHLNEYTSLDVELGFVDLDGLLDLETDLLRAMLEAVAAQVPDALEALDLSFPRLSAIPRIRMDEARDRLAPHGRTYGPEDDLDPEGERLLGRLFADEGHEFVFVTHYPAAVRPFYALPDPADPRLTLSFDLLFRGLEVTTGGMRIHDHAQLLASMAQRSIDPAPFAGYVEAFAAGMPPHGGFAIGLERLTAQLAGVRNVREATLFPRDVRRLTP